MDAVIPAAGRGTRLRPLTADRPKPLVEVAGRPLLTHCFEQLGPLDVSTFVVVVGERGDQIREHYGDSFGGTPVRYAHQPEPRGLADAVLQAREYVDGDALVMNGDNVIRGNLSELVTHKRERDVTGATLVLEVTPEVARRTGVVETDGERVTGMVEKADDPPSTLANAGCHVFDPVLFDACERIEPGAEGEYQLSDAVDLLCREAHEVHAVPLEGWRVNVNTPADVERAERHLAGTE